MALKNLQAEVDKLFELTFGQLVTSKKTGKTKSKATYKLRKVLGSNTIECTVEASYIAKTLFDQWTRQNTDAPGELQSEANKLFKQYGMAVIEEYGNENRIQRARQAEGQTYFYRKGFFELHEDTATKIRFSIGGFGRNDTSFLCINKNASANAMKRPEFEPIFSGKKVSDTAEVAHKKGYSIVEAKGDILGNRAGELMGPQGLKKGEMGPPTPGFEDYGVDTSEIGEIGSKLQALQEWRTNTELKGSNDLKVNMRNGKVVSTTIFQAQVEAKWQNRADAQQQSLLGNQLKTLLTDLQAEIKKQHDSAEKGSKQEMSRSVVDVVGDMIVMTPTKRKLYAAKKGTNRSKYNVIPKSKPMQTAKKTGTVTRKRQRIKAGGPDKTIRVPAASPESGSGRGMENYAFDMKHLLKVKNAINRRLPAQIRRNMKRPALINRSGRFSNSVEVDTILPAAQTLMVKYNYRLDPYETFENTGKKRWPRGYNPKTLISKSIRELALGLVDQKLTIRRA